MRRKLGTLFGMISCWASSYAQAPDMIYYKFEDPAYVTNHAANPIGWQPAVVGDTTQLDTGGFQGTNAFIGRGGVRTRNGIKTGWNTHIQKSFTLSFWFYSPASVPGYGYIFGDSTAPVSCLHNSQSASLRIELSILGVYELWPSVSSDTPHVYHFVYDDRSSDNAPYGTYTTYLDGIQYSTGSINGPVNVTGTGLALGFDPRNNRRGTANMNGVMDEFRWYDRALTANEVANTWNIDISPVGNCPSFTSFTMDSISGDGARMHWTPGSGNTSYFLEYGISGFTPGMGTMITGNYSADAPLVVLTGLSSETEYDIYFGETCAGGDSVYNRAPYSFKTNLSCKIPSDPGSSNITPTSADIHWTGYPGTTEFYLIYGPGGFDPAVSGDIDTALGNTHTLEGLNPDMLYDIYVVAACGTGSNSDTIGPHSVLTRCQPADQLSGNYTIDPSGVTGGTNFASFADAADHLNSCGVSGPVIFNVAAGNYQDRLFLEEIRGANNINTIVFDGNDADLVSLSDTSTDGTSATIYLNGTDYLTIKNMTISHTGTSQALGVLLQNSADHNTIDSCKIEMPSINAAICGVIATSNPNSVASASGAGDNADDLTISNCTITGGTAGIDLKGGSEDTNFGYIIRNNVFRNQWDAAIYFSDIENVSITKNDIDSLRKSYSFAIEGSISNYNISGNKIRAIRFGMDIGGTAGLISNNDIISQDIGINMANASADIFHNSVVGSPAISISGAQTGDIRNNIFYSPAGNVLISNSAVGVVCDHNLYYNGGGTMFRVAGVDYADLASWQMADTALNKYSIQGNPMFIDPSADLRVTGLYADNSGDPTVGLAEDIEGNIRSSVAPDMGAYEYSISCADVAGISVAPDFSGGSDIFTMGFDRDGDNYDIEIGPCGFGQGTGTVDTSGIGPIGISGLIPNTCYDVYVRRNCNNETSRWSGPFNFTANCPDHLKISGSYTIDPRIPASETNFTSFNDAVSALECGVKGPVVFNIAPGTYTESIVLGEVFGTAPDTTVTFRGSGVGSTVLDYSSFNNSPAIDLNGADHIVIKNMTVGVNGVGTPNIFVPGIWLHNSADHNLIDSCYIEMPPNNSIFESYGVLIANAESLHFTTYGNAANNLTVSNCKITGGSTAIYIQGDNNSQLVNRGNVIDNNTIRNSMRGIYTLEVQDIQISNNDIDSVSEGMYIIYSDDYKISGNSIRSWGSYGLKISNGSKGNPSRIANNMIISQNNASLYVDGSDGVGVYYNSLNGFPAMYIHGLSIVDVRNNIFYTQGTSSSPAGYTVEIERDLRAGNILDYNLYYGNSNSLIKMGNSAYAYLEDWKIAYPSYDAHSLTDNPIFIDPLSDLHLLYSIGYNAADTSVGITNDIDGDVRSATPAIGADEFIIPDCIPSANLNLIAAYTDSLELSWDPGSGNTFNLWYGPEGFSGNPSQNGIKVRGITNPPYVLTGLSPQTIYDIYISDNCGDTAGSSSADTSFWYGPLTVRTPCRNALSGIYTVDSGRATSGNNYNSLTEAIENLVNCGVSGPVKIEIFPGTYPNVVLQDIPGVSTVNTVTFRGAGQATIIGSSEGSTPVIYFRGADYVTFRNMSLLNTSIHPQPWGILLQASSDHNTIDSCHIELPLDRGTGIGTSSDLSSITGRGNNANYLTVSNCEITGGANGIYLSGLENDGVSNTGHLIRDNIIRNSSSTGIYTGYINNVVISGNEVHPNFYGVHIYRTNNFKISENLISAKVSYGLYLNRGNYGSDQDNRSEVINNMITSQSKGMRMTFSEKTDVFFNSIRGQAAIEINDQVSLNLHNNIFCASAGSAFSLEELGTDDIIDHNIYYRADTSSPLAIVNNNSYASLSDWKAADVLQNVNSLEADPLFVSVSDMHIRKNSPAIDAGDSTVGITEDIDGNLRPAPDSRGVDIGADEFFISCALSEDIIMDSLNCSSAVLSWTPGDTGVFSIVEYDTAGFALGSGKYRIFGSSPLTIGNLDTNTAYDVYLSDICGTDTIVVIGPVNFTTPSGPLEADFGFTVNSPTATNQTADFDGTISKGALGYVWDYGDGSPKANGATVSHSYTADGMYIVTLTITGPCGTNTITKTVEISGISVEENILSRSLKVYPNPTESKVQLHFEAQSSEDAIIRLTDLSGKVVMERHVSNINGRYEGEIDLSHLAKGSYMLRIESSDLSAVKRIVKN